MDVAVIGSGMAGMATAHGLKRRDVVASVFDQNSNWGGHTRSDSFAGFTFDEGPHVSFTKDERVKRFFESSAGEWQDIAAKVKNYYEGTWVLHPAQVNLFGLDPDLITACITDLAEAHNQEPALKNYADWLEAMYGKTFAHNFPFKYTRKYWTVEPSELGLDWVGNRMYRPDLREVVRGALAPQEKNDFHYISSYRYPSKGGYQSYMRAMADGVDVALDKRVKEVDVANKTLSFDDGSSHQFDKLVSTMPLDQLVNCITGIKVPEQVKDAANDLLCTSVVLVDIVTNEDTGFEADWFYVYDEDLCMSRVYLPHRLSPHNGIAGQTAFSAEVYYSKTKPLETPLAEIEDRVVDEYIKMGLITSRKNVVATRHRVVEYANVVFDLKRAPALDKILPFIADCGIELAGRYGKWEYLWTDDATNSGWAAAAKILGVSVDELLKGI